MPTIDKRIITRRVKKLAKSSLGIGVSSTLDDYQTIDDLFPKIEQRVDFLSDIAAEFGVHIGEFDSQFPLQALIQHICRELRK